MKIISLNKNLTPVQIEKIRIGQVKKFSIKVSEKLHNEFKKFSGDNSKIHNDLNFCKFNGYQKKVGYAFLLTSALSKIYGTLFPGGNELCLHQTCNFKSPYFINDILIIKIKVIQVNKSSKIITLNTEITCLDKIIFEGQSVLKLSLKNK